MESKRSGFVIKIKYLFYDYDYVMETYRGPRSRVYCYEHWPDDRRTVDEFCSDVIIDHSEDLGCCDRSDLFHYIIPPATSPCDPGTSMNDFVTCFRAAHPKSFFARIVVNVFRRNDF